MRLAVMLLVARLVLAIRLRLARRIGLAVLHLRLRLARCVAGLPAAHRLVDAVIIVVGSVEIALRLLLRVRTIEGLTLSELLLRRGDHAKIMFRVLVIVFG